MDSQEYSHYLENSVAASAEKANHDAALRPVQAKRPASTAPTAPTDLPPLPTRFEREVRPFMQATFQVSNRQPHQHKAQAATEARETPLRLRLFGKSAAHTLEVTAHRRGGIFWMCMW